MPLTRTGQPITKTRAGSANIWLVGCVAGLFTALLSVGVSGQAEASRPAGTPDTLSVVPSMHQQDHIANQAILFVLEGVSQDALKGNSMPVLGRLLKDGSATWTATAVQPALRLPTMASLITGMTVPKHGMTWNSFEFARGYPRPPTMFDYLDLSGGRDSTIFYMDESLYQLAKPEPYTDHQFCGALRPECRASTLVSYIRQYFQKATSGHGYGHAIPALPHLLIVHLPDAGRIGAAEGWNSKPYREALKSVDEAMGAVLDLYRDLGLLKSTVVFATSISPAGAKGFGAPAMEAGPAAPVAAVDGAQAPPQVLWMASGAGVKKGHRVTSPVSIIDTGATVMRALGLDTHTEWDSRAVDEVFVPDAEKGRP